jgi:hypothetical protein
MRINLNVYLRGKQEDKAGIAFEPQIWHRPSFLQKNFVRFFDEKYLVADLFVDVSDYRDPLPDFCFEFKSDVIEVNSCFRS